MIKVEDFVFANAGYNNAEKEYLVLANSAETQERKELYLRAAKRFQWKRIPIGYWYSEYEPKLPFPIENSSQLSISNREKLISYLKLNHSTIRYLGLSECRICHKDNGSTDVFDDKYVWPEGLVHYIEIHNVELPEEFVKECLHQHL